MTTLICLLHLSYENNGLVSHCMCITNVCLDHLIFEVNAITVKTAFNHTHRIKRFLNTSLKFLELGSTVFAINLVIKEETFDNCIVF